MLKVNDLSNSPLRKRFFENSFVSENNIAILSIRVSSKKQESGESLAEQMEITGEYVKKKELKVEKIWKVSETASKHNLRKHFHEMLKFIRASQGTSRPIKHVIFSHQSRSNRNQESARELEDLLEMGVTLHFARDGRKLTCKSDIAEIIMWHLENAKNQAEVDNLTKNAMGGTIKVIERGMTPVSVPPFGLRSEGRRAERRWVPDEEKAEYMKMAYQKIIEKENGVLVRRYSDEFLKGELDKLFPHLIRAWCDLA